MSKLLALILALFVVQLGGCSWDVRKVESTKIEADAPISDNVEELRAELRVIRLRERIIDGALKDAEQAALQTKIWIGVGASALAGIVLIGLGIWTTRRILVEIGIGALALAALGAVLAELVPYILWIGIGVLILVVGACLFMLVNREKGLRQVTNAVEDAKASIPEFGAGYKRIFNSHIDTPVDKLLNSIRGVRRG